MSTMPDPYVSANPGDLITAQLFNGLQMQIKEDIAKQIQQALAALKSVDQAGDAGKLGGKTSKELEDEIIQKALAILPTRTGYRMIFKRLKAGEEKFIEHKLAAIPLSNFLQLDYFPVVCGGQHDDEPTDGLVNFYLFQSGEKKFKTTADKKKTVEIQRTDGTPSFKIPFEAMLDLFKVKYPDKQNLGDLVDDFWEAVWKEPNNDEFEQEQYCNSPWFAQCCGERRTVGQLKSGGDWPNLFFQMRPRMTINLPEALGTGGIPPTFGAPPHLQVVHYDFNTMGIKLVEPELPETIPELKLMILLKV